MTVYSTDRGRLCPSCHSAITQCHCADLPLSADGSAVRVHREVKGRNGKPVSIIRGLSLNKSELKRLCQTLKKGCGVGGSVIEGNILIQGDHRDKIISLLAAADIPAKLGGG